LELHKEINYRFSEIGGVKFRFIQNRGGKTAFEPNLYLGTFVSNEAGLYIFWVKLNGLVKHIKNENKK
jgi:hypothetical protein